jgi:glycosyltransferase involved in cell wall biosynthesis
LNDKVSVVIPVYNSEKFLKESLESVLNQTYSNIEIITVNDGSTDGSLEILRQYENKITIINQKNLGLAEAVNAGIKKMSGHWMKWLSPDDVLYSNAIEFLVAEAKKVPENTILYSNWKMIDEKGNRIRDFYESNYNNLDSFEFNTRLLDEQQINVNTVLIPVSLFKNGCVMRTLNDTIAVDYDFFLRAGIIYNMKFHLIEKNLLKYRIHTSQTSHKNILKSLKYLVQLKKDLLLELDKSTRNKYEISLKKYSKNKKISRKLMEFGLKIVTKLLPESLSEQILVFYLNKIRNGR